MVLADGQSVTGAFAGFRDHRFVLRTGRGEEHSEFASDVRSVRLTAPLSVSAQFVNKRFDNVHFTGYADYAIRFTRAGEQISEPVPLLVRMDVITNAVSARAAASGGTEGADAGGPAPAAGRQGRAVPVDDPGEPGERQWTRSGRWREVADPEVRVISRGEAVDIGGSLAKGTVNVVHFNLPSVLSSVRQGGYIAAMASRSKGRFVVARVDIADWNSPICGALDLKSLPQFWFYSRSGRLTRKLTARFTEADIDAALKEALQAN